MSDPAEIAGKLTKAQREDLLHGNCAMKGDRCLCASPYATALAAAGLIGEPNVAGGRLFTPLGLAVRRHLLENGNG